MSDSSATGVSVSLHSLLSAESSWQRNAIMALVEVFRQNMARERAAAAERIATSAEAAAKTQSALSARFASEWQRLTAAAAASARSAASSRLEALAARRECDTLSKAAEAQEHAMAAQRAELTTARAELAAAREDEEKVLARFAEAADAAKAAAAETEAHNAEVVSSAAREIASLRNHAKGYVARLAAAERKIAAGAAVSWTQLSCGVDAMTADAAQASTCAMNAVAAAEGPTAPAHGAAEDAAAAAATALRRELTSALESLRSTEERRLSSSTARSLQLGEADDEDEEFDADDDSFSPAVRSDTGASPAAGDDAWFASRGRRTLARLFKRLPEFERLAEAPAAGSALSEDNGWAGTVRPHGSDGAVVGLGFFESASTSVEADAL